MQQLLQQDEYRFISDGDKAFIVAFDDEMERLGYTCNRTIGEGYVWGRKMIIYTKAGVKSKKCYARVYIREDDLVLRLYFSQVDKHRDAVEQAPDYIQDAFTGYGTCQHCHNMKPDGTCMHRKTYTIKDVEYEVCDGLAFWFFKPDTTRLPEYIKLFTAFYPMRKRRAQHAQLI